MANGACGLLSRSEGRMREGYYYCKLQRRDWRLKMALRTIISRSSSSILAALKHAIPDSPQTLLFAISPHHSLPDSQLADIVAALTRIPNSLGCISSPLPLRSREPASALSLAFFDVNKCTPFRSTIPGRKPTSVGRWHSVRSSQDSRHHGKRPQTDLEEIRGIEHHDLPPELQNTTTENASTIIYFSDNSPEGLSQTLSTAFPGSTHLGFLASPTPFLTGRPFTLFRNREIHSSGAVGISLPTPTPTWDLVYPDLNAITDALTVTSAEGNLVHSLDDANPARLIISAMDKHNMNLSGANTLYKEDQYYLGVLGEDDKLHRLYQIMSGGPSRGTVSLEGEDGPSVGSRAKLYHLPSKLKSTDLLIQPNTQLNTFTFLNLHPEPTPDTAAFQVVDHPSDETTVLQGTFLAASENGCVVRRRRQKQGGSEGETPWRFSVPSGSVRLHW
ncbi:hypothetical protein BXZ70DRAFT_709448 [Cristinia sonorae]|uniref:FIST domain-containing protein n=1 Tax=Cristinia sonorae TaxID=1940300 RepID=A0A8K0UCZ0_9AGAR|nr:hypothetical protein BXZ70DRAFT_709448 [Cristinia sonorae]